MQEIKKENINIDRSEIWQNRLKWIMPILAITFAIIIWELLVKVNDIPHYLIPAPSKILSTLWTDGPSLLKAMLFTIKLTFFSLLLAIVGGVLLGMLFALSRTVEMSLFPFAVILQVTPVIAIAPLILIYVNLVYLFCILRLYL